jgi:ribosome modulation factor
MTSAERKTYDEAYREGYNAFCDGYAFEDNPYPYKTVPYGGWYDGWREAHTDEGGDYDSR